MTGYERFPTSDLSFNDNLSALHTVLLDWAESNLIRVCSYSQQAALANIDIIHSY